MNEKALGKRLQLARKRAGLTQQQLCQKAGLSYSTLAKIERGAIASPSVFTVASVAEVTGSTFEELLGIKLKTGSPALPAKKRSKSGVRFVYFDINGVLVRFFHKAFTQVSKETGVASDAIETFFWRHNADVCSNKIDMAKFNELFAKELGVKHFEWQKYYMKNVEPMPGVSSLASWAAENFEVGLLSDSMPGIIDGLIKAGKLPKVDYAAIADSSKIGTTKNDAKFYKHAQVLANAGPEEILLIDDNRSNLIVADGAGWHVLWFDDYQPAESIERAKRALEF